MTDEQLKTCPVCTFGPVEASWHEHKKEVDCPACGKFVIGELNQWLWILRDEGKLTDEHRAILRRLSIAIRHSASPPFITFENWERLAAEAPRFTMAAKLRRLLEVAGRKATPGQRFSIGYAEMPVLMPEIGAADREEIELLLNHLTARGYLQGSGTAAVSLSRP